MQLQDFTKFQLLKPRLLEVVDKMLAEDIAKLMAMIPLEEDGAGSDPIVRGEIRNVSRLEKRKERQLIFVLNRWCFSRSSRHHQSVRL